MKEKGNKNIRRNKSSETSRTLAGERSFGYKNARDETNKPIIVPDEKAEIVRKIFSDFSKGRTQVEIRLECKKLGFAISKSQFSRILSNPAYIGKVLVRDKKNDMGYYINGIHKPLITLALFEKVQLQLNGNKKKRNMPKVQTIKDELYLRSHLLCPNCGNNMTGSGSKSRSGIKHYYYHCNHCSKVRFRADGVHERILAILNEIKFSRNGTELYNFMVKKIFQDRTTKKRNRSEENISQEITIYQNRIANLQDDYADRKISLEDYNASIDRYRQKIQALHLEIRESKTIQARNGEFLKSGINLLANLKKFYVSANVSARMRILGSIFPEKLIFEENKSRTTKINEAVRLILATDKDFNEKGTTKIFKNSALSLGWS